MNTKLSIIMPVYNAAETLSHSVNSVLSQKMQDFELIIINDGSKDESLAICNAFSEKDERIKVIDKTNEGVSIARNVGLSYATGEYIAFLDADDWFEADAFGKICDAADENSANILLFDTYIVKSTERPYEIDSIDMLTKSTLLLKKDISPDLLKYMAGTVWRCIYKRELLENNNVLFPAALPLSEDRIFNIVAFGCSDSVYYLKEPYYCYNAMNESAVTKYRDNFFDIALRIQELMSIAFDEYWSREYTDFYRSMNVVAGAKTALFKICNAPGRTNFRETLEKIKKIANNQTLQEAILAEKKHDTLEKFIIKKKYFEIYCYQHYLHTFVCKIKKITGTA